jgi:hypothetical protein
MRIKTMNMCCTTARRRMRRALPAAARRVSGDEMKGLLWARRYKETASRHRREA